MRHFNNILYTTTGSGEEIEGLKQALSLAAANNASLTVLLVYPELPETQQDYREQFRTFMHQQTEERLAATRAALGLPPDNPQVSMVVESGDSPPAISMIQHVLRAGCDLLIKEAEVQEEAKGFKAMDMTLLRKCPCPVWLARPISRPRGEIRVAVAINPENRDQTEHDLSLRLLELSRSLADICSGELDILSCWDFEFERYLRRGTRANLPDAGIQGAVDYAQSAHSLGLSNLIQESGIDGVFHVHRLRGRAEERIPAFVRGRGVDILVMGSVARTGIIGFLMGNTAENVMQELNCALVALKPGGFVSPVKAY
jgi:nucleotide-binding universal stress UspA family protein